MSTDEVKKPEQVENPLVPPNLDSYEIKSSDPMNIKHGTIALDFVKEFGKKPDKIALVPMAGQNNRIRILVYFKLQN